MADTQAATLVRPFAKDVKNGVFKYIYTVPWGNNLCLSGVYCESSGSIKIRINGDAVIWESIADQRQFRGIAFNAGDVLEITSASSEVYIQDIMICWELFRTP